LVKAYHESDAHQRAKQQIAAACARAGYAVIIEAAGVDWRADVLAVRGAVALAFEVQWSRLRLADALARQTRYTRDGVRGCWFFRTPPGTRAAPELATARHDLPLFHLLANADGSFSVALDGRQLALDDLVMRLVDGRVRFCPAAAIAGAVELTIGLYRVTCPVCRGEVTLPRLNGGGLARCGAAVPIAPAAGGVLGDACALPGEVRAGACPLCAAPIPERVLWLAHYGITPYRVEQRRTTLTQPIITPHAHWCAPDDGVWCG
jgi:hypothetical protein